MAISREEQLKILGRMKDSDIDYSDVEATDQEFWKGAAFHVPPAKIPVSLRLDEDVLVWYKKQTVSGYQFRGQIGEQLQITWVMFNCLA